MYWYQVLSNSVFILSLVLIFPYFCLFIFTLSVAGAESWRYFWTARAVNTCHDEICLLLITFRSGCLGGLNVAWWRYLMSYALDVMAYTLYAMCLVLTVFVSVNVFLYIFSVNINNLVCCSRPPFHTGFVL